MPVYDGEEVSKLESKTKSHMPNRVEMSTNGLRQSPRSNTKQKPANWFFVIFVFFTDSDWNIWNGQASTEIPEKGKTICSGKQQALW